MCVFNSKCKGTSASFNFAISKLRRGGSQTSAWSKNLIKAATNLKIIIKLWFLWSYIKQYIWSLLLHRLLVWILHLKLLKQINTRSDNGCHSRTHTNTEVENALERVMPEESSFFHGNVKAALLGLLWEVSGDRTGLSNTADGATRSQTWLLHRRTCVSGRLNGCLNTHGLVNKGQIAPGG